VCTSLKIVIEFLNTVVRTKITGELIEQCHFRDVNVICAFEG
jgi:hypothetical protein